MPTTGSPFHLILAGFMVCSSMLISVPGDGRAQAQRREQDERQNQYLVLNIIPGERYDSAFAQIQRLPDSTSSGCLQLGIAAVFSYLGMPREQCEQELLEFLSLSERYGIPVVVQLDGEQWWEARPDLWNWWDSTRSGFDPRNRWNVEWSGWDPARALKIAWTEECRIRRTGARADGVPAIPFCGWWIFLRSVSLLLNERKSP